MKFYEILTGICTQAQAASLPTWYGLVADLLRGNWCNGCWPLGSPREWIAHVEWVFVFVIVT